MAGRKPKPTALKRLEGNPGKRPLNTREPQPRKKRPKMPAHLTPAAQAHWRRVLRILSPMGVITEAEADLIAVYVDAYARWEQEHSIVYGPRLDTDGRLAVDDDGMPLRPEGTITYSGNGTPMRNPRLKIIDDAHKLMVRCQAELGMTPSARSRLVAPTNEVKPVNALREMARMRVVELTRLEAVDRGEEEYIDGETIDAE